MPAKARTVRGGYFIAFEGGEGTGKSCQAKAAAEELRSRGWAVTLTREPGHTHIGSQIRGMLLDCANADLVPRAEALLYAADRAQHAAQAIRPALERGEIVVCDRYIDSSVAYQGHGRDLGSFDISYLSMWATNGLLPHMTVVLDLDVREALKRRKPVADRIESEPLDFHERVRHGFLRQAADQPWRYVVVDSAPPVQDVADDIMRRLRAHLGGYTDRILGSHKSSCDPSETPKQSSGTSD